MKHSVNEVRTTWVATKGIALEDFLVLTLHVLNKSRDEFFREHDHLLTDAEYKHLLHLLERRSKHEPVAYLTGSKEFFGRNFFVNAYTLIPRPETECLVEDILSFGKNTRNPDYIFDIGTGSGILAITLAKELKNMDIEVLASDISTGALAVAKKNANAHKADIQFLEGSLLEPFQSILASKNTYIVANLPYVSETLLKSAAPDVKDYEPHTALLSENDGLEHYIQLFNEMKKSDIDSGFCWIEISPEQSAVLAEKIQDIFPGTEVFIGQDLSQRDRFIRFSF